MSDWRDEIPKLLRSHRERVHDLSGVGYECPRICEIAADEIERLTGALAEAKSELHIWMSVFPDIAPRAIIPKTETMLATAREEGRKQGLEDAAMVAERAPYTRGGIVCGCSEGLANWTAAAIRALKEKQP
jgi:hypothetical protein